MDGNMPQYMHPMVSRGRGTISSPVFVNVVDCMNSGPPATIMTNHGAPHKLSESVCSLYG